ncbi:MAG: hypothetical protein FWG14_04685 [Peptococcaceae bacterium]|nr:hypothetical protein [Peptococcaceae bacterium]
METKTYDITINKDISSAKDIIDRLMKQMNFTMTYTNSLEAIAKRGSGLATTFMGPLAGKYRIAVKFKLSFQSETSNTTTVTLSDVGSQLNKDLTMTKGTTKQVLEDVYSTLIEEIRREGI